MVGAIGVVEFFTITQVENSFEIKDEFPTGEKREAWDFKFDPFGYKPTTPEALLDMQTKEINNGRLAMIAVAGMVAQELVTGQKL